MEIFFCKIGFDELKPLVELGFGDDQELMDRYQQLPTEFEETVQRNLDNILGISKLYALEYFKVYWGNDVIGFTVLCLETKLLCSFGINIKYRKKEILLSWIDTVNQRFDGEFCCLLWNQNKRAIEFLHRNGMEIQRVEESYTVLVKNK